MLQGYFLEEGAAEVLEANVAPAEYMALHEMRNAIAPVDHTPYGSFNIVMSATTQDKERIDIYEFYTHSS